MICIYRIAAAGALAAGLLGSIGLPVHADDAASKPKAKPAETTSKPSEAAEPQRKLSPELAALRDRVRRLLAVHQKQTFNTRQNSATEIMSVCLAFGCGAEVSLEGPGGRRINGIACLCWNYPCHGFKMLGFSHDHIAARIGYGCQQRGGEFLAMLAMSRVPSDYPVRIGKDVRSVADLVEAEQLACRSGGDLSLRLIGLAHYVDEPEWKNDLGETWTISRMIKEEIARPILTAPEGGLNRLMGLSYAVDRRMKRKQPIEGQFKRVRKYTADYQTFALQLQNSDGSWGPSFLAAKSASPDAASQLRSTGRVLEWLAFSLPEKEMDDPRVVNAVECVTRLLGANRYQWNAPMLPTREIVSLGHALHALAIYDRRVFFQRPAEADAKPAAEKRSNLN